MENHILGRRFGSATDGNQKGRKGPGGTTGSISNSVEVETLHYDLFNRGAFDDVRRSEVLKVAIPLLEGHPSVRSICTLAYGI